MRILKNGYQNANEKEKRSKGRHSSRVVCIHIHKILIKKTGCSIQPTANQKSKIKQKTKAMKTSRIQLLKLAKNGHRIILNGEDVSFMYLMKMQDDIFEITIDQSSTVHATTK